MPPEMHERERHDDAPPLGELYDVGAGRRLMLHHVGTGTPAVVIEAGAGSFGLDYGDYLLFYGALEPKKNVQRLIDAYLLAAVDIPLVVTGASGWGNLAEIKLLKQLQEDARAHPEHRRRVHHLQYVSIQMLDSRLKILAESAGTGTPALAPP